MIISRSWAMPNKNTFTIKPINKIISDYLQEGDEIIDPFVNNSPFKDVCSITNDLDPDIEADYHLDALVFLKAIDHQVDTILFDPPYSPRQVSECYKSLGHSVNMQTTQASFWGNMKKEVSRLVRQGGHVLTFGWNSGGMGKKNGFQIVEILLVAHGGWHNDTIVTVERKIKCT